MHSKAKWNTLQLSESRLWDTINIDFICWCVDAGDWSKTSARCARNVGSLLILLCVTAILNVHYEVSEEYVLIRGAKSSLTKFFFCLFFCCFFILTPKQFLIHFHDWMNTVSFCFSLFICGGPYHLSIFKTVFWDLIFIWERLVYSLVEKIEEEIVV